MKGIKISPKHVGRLVVITSGICAGISGTLTFYMYNLNGADYVEVNVPGDSRYIVPAARVELCEQEKVS